VSAPRDRAADAAGGLSAAERALVRMALAEDLPGGDATSEAIVPADRTARAAVVAREAAVVAGLTVAAEVARAVDARILARAERSDGTPVADGDRVVAGERVLALDGPARGILAAERTLLNFLGRLSGVATTTRAFVDAVAGTGVRILDTRKTTPGWRSLEKAAVRAGGGTNHRIDASSMILVKDNHRLLLGGMAPCLAALGRGAGALAAAGGGAAGSSSRTRGLPVEVEADSLADVCALIDAGVDRILLDNMDLATLERAVASIRGSGRAIFVEASGGVRLDTVRAIALTGVDAISIGALTRDARWIDFSLDVTA
jgi:nicotinate-nucleotide pyrophosphorylase (carboxylating)